MRPTVIVCAGSRLPQNPNFIAAAEAFGRALGAEGYDIIYGGGTQGLMGVVAKAAQDAGAHITAVVLDKYAHEEQLENVTIINSNTELDRFEKMCGCNQSAAIIIFPGGPGTKREALQAIENAVYEDGCPVILTKIGNTLNAIMSDFRQSIYDGFTKPEKANSVRVWELGMFLRTVLRPNGTPPKRERLLEL